MSPSIISSVPVVMMLIQEIRKNAACVWNTNDFQYNNRFHVGLAWKKVAKKIGKNEHLLRLKWKNLKDTFRKEQKKFPCEELSEYKGKWIFFEHLYFLKQYDMAFKDVEPIDKEDFANEQDNDDDDNDRLGLETFDNDDNENNGISIKQESQESDNDDDSNILTVNKIRDTKKRKRDSEIHNEISFVNVEEVDTNKNMSTKEYEYDEMFLKSLTPFFSRLDKMRKLIVRGRFQDILMNELAAQQSSQK